MPAHIDTNALSLFCGALVLMFWFLGMPFQTPLVIPCCGLVLSACIALCKHRGSVMTLGVQSFDLVGINYSGASAFRSHQSSLLYIWDLHSANSLPLWRVA